MRSGSAAMICGIFPENELSHSFCKKLRGSVKIPFKNGPLPLLGIGLTWSSLPCVMWVRREGLPAAWAFQVLEINSHLFIRWDSGIAARTGYVQRCANLLKIEL